MCCDLAKTGQYVLRAHQTAFGSPLCIAAKLLIMISHAFLSAALAFSRFAFSKALPSSDSFGVEGNVRNRFTLSILSNDTMVMFYTDAEYVCMLDPGKSTSVMTISNIYCDNFSIVGTMETKGHAQFALEHLLNSQVIIAPELDESFQLGQTVINKMMAGEPMSVDRKGRWRRTRYGMLRCLRLVTRKPSSLCFCIQCSAAQCVVDMLEF
ncbi:TPA: hypothetical protein ACH3X1_002419 [Trebouxia sp. C0004]